MLLNTPTNHLPIDTGASVSQILQLLTKALSHLLIEQNMQEHSVSSVPPMVAGSSAPQFTHLPSL